MSLCVVCVGKTRSLRNWQSSTSSKTPQPSSAAPSKSYRSLRNEVSDTPLCASASHGGACGWNLLAYNFLYKCAAHCDPFYKERHSRNDQVVEIVDVSEMRAVTSHHYGGVLCELSMMVRTGPHLAMVRAEGMGKIKTAQVRPKTAAERAKTTCLHLQRKYTLSVSKRTVSCRCHACGFTETVSGTEDHAIATNGPMISVVKQVTSSFRDVSTPSHAVAPLFESVCSCKLLESHCNQCHGDVATVLTYDSTASTESVRRSLYDRVISRFGSLSIPVLCAFVASVVRTLPEDYSLRRLRLDKSRIQAVFQALRCNVGASLGTLKKWVGTDKWTYRSGDRMAQLLSVMLRRGATPRTDLVTWEVPVTGFVVRPAERKSTRGKKEKKAEKEEEDGDEEADDLLCDSPSCPCCKSEASSCCRNQAGSLLVVFLPAQGMCSLVCMKGSEMRSRLISIIEPHQVSREFLTVLYPRV